MDAKPVAVTVQADKPDTGQLIPHGVQGAQSRIDLNDEQTANAKGIIAATKKAGLPGQPVPDTSPGPWIRQTGERFGQPTGGFGNSQSRCAGQGRDQR
ncbi:hypothetical protein [Micromonospora sp. NPDC005220]|uniref:hypothetical protein n=1 Tax=Micromonospora sp. NPDC005220 TaxID=3155589 RepID=UPI0033BA8209